MEMKRIKTQKSSFTLVSLVLFLGMIMGLTAPSAMAAKKLPFCAYQALSGPAATWGIPNLMAIQLEADIINETGGFEVNGTKYQYEIIPGDHKYIPAEAAKLANKGVYRNKCKFMGIMGGSPSLAALPTLKENKVLLMGYAGGGQKLTNPKNPLVFRYNPAIEIMYALILPEIKRREGVKTMAVLNPDDATGHSGLVAAKEGAKYAGLEIVATDYFERGTKDLSSMLTRVIAKNPDMIETSYTAPATAALICKQARELGYKGVIMLSWGPDAEQVLKIAGPHAENAYLVLAGPIKPVTLQQKMIYKRFVDKWGEKDWSSTFWSNFGLLSTLTAAIEKTQSFDPYKIANVMQDLEVSVPMGTVYFGGSKYYGIKRQLVFPETLYQIRNAKPEFLVTLEKPEGVME